MPIARDIRTDVLEYLAERPYERPHRDFMARDLGYSSWASLERVLYRKGCRDLVHAMLPERRKREDVEGKGNPKHIRSTKRAKVPPQRRRVS